MKKLILHTVLLSCLVMGSYTQAQSKKQQELEQKRQDLQREIQQIETLLFKGRTQQKSILLEVEDLSYKASVRQNLINITNQQANLLTKEINDNQKKITQLRAKLKLLKDEYAAMVVKSYKGKGKQSKVMFLLSSSNFQQAYKRLRYIKQYADHQKQQAEEIKIQTLKLQELNKQLAQQKEEKQKLIEENRRAKALLEKELKQKESLEASIKGELRNYNAQIRSKQQEVDKLDREIERIIKEAMAASNKKAGKATTSKTFALTPEEKRLADNFMANKGKLPWPVEEGVVKMRYGRQPSLIDKSVPIKSNGVRIVTNKEENVRAVFNGTVQAIMTPKNGNNVVMIKHGNYFSIYKNLSKINVKKGDEVFTKQVIGKVRTNKANGETLLSFAIWKEGKPQDPSQWIYKM